MRNKNRIPIVLKLFKNKDILSDFLNTHSQQMIDRVYNNWDDIVKQWEENPDLRFGQLLFNFDLIPDHPYNIEEDEWLIKNNYIKFEEIKFWGINYDKNGDRLSTFKYKLLKDLDLDHIKNIIKWFKDINYLDKLNPKYLEYFNKRIEENV